jgi:hypothetical protein
MSVDSTAYLMNTPGAFVLVLLLVLGLDAASTPSITETRRCGKTERDEPRITIRYRARLET